MRSRFEGIVSFVATVQSAPVTNPLSSSTLNSPSITRPTFPIPPLTFAMEDSPYSLSAFGTQEINRNTDKE